MKIDKSKLKHGIWYEDKDGNYIPSTESVDVPEEAVTCHVCFPLQIRTEHYNIKPRVDPDGNVRRTYYGSDRFLTTSCHIGGGNEPVILAMANSGDYTLSEALAVYANACERCANVLAYTYLNGAEWKCEYGANKFGTAHDYNGDPDILCQRCGFPTVKEVVMRKREYTEEEMAQIRAMVDRGRFA